MSCWPVLSGRMRDAFYLLSPASLLVGNLCVLPPRKHQDREKQLFLKDALKDAQILKSMRNKHIVIMKVVCENPLAIMLEYVFFEFALFSLEGRVSSLQNYFEYISAREEMVSSFPCSHTVIRSCHTSTERCWQRISAALSFFFCIAVAIHDALLTHSHMKTTRANDWEI